MYADFKTIQDSNDKPKWKEKKLPTTRRDWIHNVQGQVIIHFENRYAR